MRLGKFKRLAQTQALNSRVEGETQCKAWGQMHAFLTCFLLKSCSLSAHPCSWTNILILWSVTSCWFILEARMGTDWMILCTHPRISYRKTHIRTAQALYEKRHRKCLSFGRGNANGFKADGHPDSVLGWQGLCQLWEISQHIPLWEIWRQAFSKALCLSQSPGER